MAHVEPTTPSGQHRAENERQTYGGERRWSTGAGERWTSASHAGRYGENDRETDPESARWRRDDIRDERGIVRRFTDELGLTTPSPRNYKRSDGRIYEDVCERLWDEHRVEVGDVSVQVKDGTVTLEGTVPERRMKHIIEDLAAGTRGVQEVENRITVSRIGAM